MVFVIIFGAFMSILFMTSPVPCQSFQKEFWSESDWNRTRTDFYFDFSWVRKSTLARPHELTDQGAWHSRGTVFSYSGQSDLHRTRIRTVWLLVTWTMQSENTACFSVEERQLYTLKPDVVHLNRCYQISPPPKKAINPRVDSRRTYYRQ